MPREKYIERSDDHRGLLESPSDVCVSVHRVLSRVADHQVPLGCPKRRRAEADQSRVEIEDGVGRIQEHGEIKDEAGGAGDKSKFGTEQGNDRGRDPVCHREDYVENNSACVFEE